MTVGIIGAMKVEVDSLVQQMHITESENISGNIFFHGTFNNNEIIIVESGIGKVNAAVCTQSLILRYAPEYVINIGVAGGLSKSLKFGDVVAASSVVQYDIDTSVFGDPIGLIPKINLVNIDCSDILNNLLLGIDSGIKLGVIATGDKFIKSIDEVEYVSRHFNAMAIDMESGSIGQVCRINNTGFAIIRSISDNACDSAGIEYETNLSDAAEKPIELVRKLLNLI